MYIIVDNEAYEYERFSGLIEEPEVDEDLAYERWDEEQMNRRKDDDKQGRN